MGGKTDADQIIIVVGLIRVIKMVDVEYMFPIGCYGFDASRRNQQAVDFHSS